MVMCAICKRKLKAVTNTHLQKAHGITTAEYKTRFPGVHLLSIRQRVLLRKRLQGLNVGRLRPDQSKRQRENNVMWQQATRNKMKRTRRKLMDEGRIRPMNTLPIDGPTDAEKRAIATIKELSLPLKFVGDGKFYVGRKCPDFIYEEMKIAVELDRGTKTNEAIRAQYEETKYYLKYGWRLFHIMDTTTSAFKLLAPLFQKEKEWHKITKIERQILRKPKRVYNIECQPHNNYIANRIIIHNCFAYMFKTNNPGFRSKLHAVDSDRMIAALRGNPGGGKVNEIYESFYKKRFLIHWGGLADPFCNFEKANKIGYKIMKEFARLAYPVLFSFKGSAIFRPEYVKLLQDAAHQKNFAFQVSMITGDDDMARELEIGVPVPTKRLRAIKMLSDMGYWTILRLRPYIIGITDVGIEDLLERALEAGIDAVSMEFVALDQRSNAGLLKRYKWLGKQMGVQDIQTYFKALSPQARGGYLRLNRLVKERFVRQVYDFCVKHDLLYACSDPDFKELNMSGSCCGMPDKYKPNPELQNWTKNQLTWHLKEARRKYHSTGQIVQLRFGNVFKPDEDTYLNSVALGQDHPTVVDKSASERSTINHLVHARKAWNNLRSPANPRNYFHGKLMPVTLDPEDNLIYKYVPSEYEARWYEEGVDLTK